MGINCNLIQGMEKIHLRILMFFFSLFCNIFQYYKEFFVCNYFYLIIMCNSRYSNSTRHLLQDNFGNNEIIFIFRGSGDVKRGCGRDL